MELEKYQPSPEEIDKAERIMTDDQRYLSNLRHEVHRVIESNLELPYEDTEAGFAKWFREAAKDRWEKYLRGDESDISIEERDIMREFLIEHGTADEIQDKLDSFGFNILADEALQEEIKSRRPDVIKIWRKRSWKKKRYGEV